MSNSDGAIIIDADIELDGISKGAAEINKTMEQVEKKADSVKIEPSADGLKEAKKELNNLDKAIEKQTSLVDEAESKWRDYVAWAKNGGNAYSPIMQQYREEYERTATSLDGLIDRQHALKQAVDKTEISLKTSKSETKEMGNATDDAGRKLKETAKQASVLDTALAVMVANGIQSAVNGLFNLADKAQDLRKSFAVIEQNAKDFGKSMKVVDESMAEFAGTGANMDEIITATSNLMATGFNDNQMLDVIQALSGAVVRFPTTVKIDNLAEGLQRTISQGKASEQFGELITKMASKTGVSLEEFNAKLASTTSETRRQQYALDYLAKTGLADAYDGYKENEKALYDSYVAQYEYNKAISDFGETIMPIKTSMTELATKMLEFASTLDPEFIKGVTVALVGFLGVVISLKAIVGAKNAVADFFGMFKKTKDTAKAVDTVKNFGDSAKKAGSNAKSAASDFLLYAVGVAAVAASIAVLVIATAELVKAFNGSQDGAIKTAVAIAIVFGAVTVAVGGISALYKLIGSNTAQFVVFAAGIVLITTAMSLLITTTSGLVEALNAGDGSATETATAIVMMMGAMTGAIAIIVGLGAATSRYSTQILLLALGISMVTLGLSALYNAKARLAEASNGYATKEDVQNMQMMSQYAKVLEVSLASAAGAALTFGDNFSYAMGEFNSAPKKVWLVVTPLLALVPAMAAVNALARTSAAGMNIFAAGVDAAAKAMNGLSSAMQSIKGGKLQFSPSNGYASGTQSARRGWNWIDETTGAPKLAWFAGGETVLTTSQSAARQSMLGGSGGTTIVKNYNLGGVSLPANNIKSFTQLISIFENEAAGMQQGTI